MRFLIHTDEYNPTEQACTYRMESFANAFMACGEDVTVITSSANKTNSIPHPHKERILYSPAIPMKKKTTIMRMINNLSFGISSVFTAMGAGKFDVVLTTSPPVISSISGWLIARMKHAKLVYDVRDIWPDIALEMGAFSQESLYCRVFSAITCFMYQHADMIISVSPRKIEKIERYAAQSSRRNEAVHKVEFIGNGFDETVLLQEYDSSIVQQYSFQEHFTCVYIGNIGLAQGLGTILELATKTKHKHVQFLIFGKGAEEEILKKRSAQEGLTNVHFCGVLPHDRIASVLSEAKLSIIPLKSANMKDSIPTKLYESLGLGCPVLLIAEGDSCKIVYESGLGCCVSPDEPEAIPAVFDKMVENYRLYEVNREKSKRLIREKYSRQVIAMALHEKISRLVSRG